MIWKMAAAQFLSTGKDPEDAWYSACSVAETSRAGPSLGDSTEMGCSPSEGSSEVCAEVGEGVVGSGVKP